MPDLSNIWISTAIATFGSSTFTGFLTWWIKGRIEHGYKEKLAEHEAKIKSEYDAKIEQIRAENARQQFKFSKVFEKTETIIYEMYLKIIAVQKKFEDYPSWKDESDKDARLINVMNSARDMNHFFRLNKIYIPKDTARKIEDFHLKLSTIQIHRHLNDITVNNENLKEQSDLVKSLLTALEDDFQRILGFPIPDKK